MTIVIFTSNEENPQAYVNDNGQLTIKYYLNEHGWNPFGPILISNSCFYYGSLWDVTQYWNTYYKNVQRSEFTAEEFMIKNFMELL